MFDSAVQYNRLSRIILILSKSYMKQESLEMFLKCCLTRPILQSRMSIGNEFQADGAETAKALSVNRRRVRGVMKPPLDLERSRLSVHGLHSSHKYNGAVPQKTRYIKTHILNLMRLLIHVND